MVKAVVAAAVATTNAVVARTVPLGQVIVSVSWCMVVVVVVVSLTSFSLIPHLCASEQDN